MTKESVTQEIQKAIKDEKIIIGTDRVIKGLKKGEVKKVIITTNAPEIVKEDISHYGKLAGAEIIIEKITNEELKEICKKPFNISIIGFI